ncbi:Protein CutA like protein [Trachymyrmex septentrionalis]|uniref:Protein CutA like protein n=1 Tax=Trachymyrmex septentrionalis TaxID=34720 RepID=A0A195FKA6_9HYME|nr:PREDICTED: protein CutA homolog [Trachymyrmex septentrionalis]KYN40692.1 Protein CutA like protein [Trachymyrmex septentrionalis]
MTRATLVTLLMLLCIARSIRSQIYQNMSSLAGVHSVAYVTVPDDAVAKRLARGLVENKLAACVNIIPQLTSVYEWEGKIQEESELLLMIKTRTEKVDALTKYVKENHPYTICEVISLPIQNGNSDYLKWISEVVPSLDKNA